MTAPAVPNNSADLEAALSDSATLKALDSPKAFAEWVDEYAKKAHKADPGIKDQVTEELIETQRALANVLKEFGDKNAKRPNFAENIQPARSKAYNKRGAGAKVDDANIFADHSEFFTTIFHKNNSAAAQERRAKLDQIRNDYGTIVPSDGGFIVPESLRSELLRVGLEKSVVRPRARVIPMETQEVIFPVIDSTSNASSVFGGVIAYWTEESAALTESQATFGRVALKSHKLTAYAEYPNELPRDAMLSFTAFIEDVYPSALAWHEDVAFFTGTGVGEPLGFLNADAAVSVSKESGQTATTIVWENLVKAYARMLPSSMGNAVWVANNDTFPELATMALSVGTGGSAIWLNDGASGPPMTILGRPVIFTEKCPTIGTVGDINLVDFSYYLVGDRQTMTADTSPHYKFANDQTAVRFIQRLDGRPWILSAITPKTGSNTLSPFVKVATRA